MKRVCALFFPVILAACSSGGGGIVGPRTEGGFPTRAALDALATRPTPAIAEVGEYHDPETWTLAGPFPPDHALRMSGGRAAWHQMLATKLGPSGGTSVASAGMQCVADALARFFVEHSSYPSPSARAFLLGRCRALPFSISIRSLSGEVPETTTDDQVWAQWGADVQKMIGEVSPDRFESMGVAYARAGSKAAFIVARGERRVHLEPVRVDNGEAVVKGRLLIADGGMRASVNQGEFGYAQCAEDASVRLPAFEFRCPLRAEDPSAWIQIASFPPGRVLGKTAALLLVGPSGEPPATLHRRAFAGANAEVTAASLRASFVKAVNGIRAQAGLSPLTEAPLQSEKAAELAPHYFHASYVSQDLALAETIFLGLRAGWQIADTVRYGLVSTSLSVGTSQLRFLLGGLLDLPLGRETLLDPKVQRIALGSVFDPPHQMMGVLVSTYALFGGDDPKSLAETARARLDAARAAAGLPASTPMLGLEAADQAPERLASGQSPDQALSNLLGTASHRLGIGVQGYRLEVGDLDRLEWPDEITKRADPKLHLSVGWYQPEGEPWGRYVIFCVFPAPGEAI